MALRSESSLLNSIVAALTILWIRFLKFVTAPVAKDSRYQTLSSNKNIVPLEMFSVHFNRASIKAGTWNIPEHPGTWHNYHNYEKNM